MNFYLTLGKSALGHQILMYILNSTFFFSYAHWELRTILLQKISNNILSRWTKKYMSFCTSCLIAGQNNTDHPRQRTQANTSSLMLWSGCCSRRQLPLKWHNVVLACSLNSTGTGKTDRDGWGTKHKLSSKGQLIKISIKRNTVHWVYANTWQISSQYSISQHQSFI